MDRGAQRAAVYGTAKSRTRLKWLSTRTKARELQEHDQMDPLRALSTICIRWREMTKTGRKERCLQSLFLVSLVLLVWTVQQTRGDEIRGIGGVKSADSAGPCGSVKEPGVPCFERRSHDRVLNRGLSGII